MDPSKHSGKFLPYFLVSPILKSKTNVFSHKSGMEKRQGLSKSNSRRIQKDLAKLASPYLNNLVVRGGWQRRNSRSVSRSSRGIWKSFCRWKRTDGILPRAQRLKLHAREMYLAPVPVRRRVMRPGSVPPFCPLLVSGSKRRKTIKDLLINLFFRCLASVSYYCSIAFLILLLSYCSTLPIIFFALLILCLKYFQYFLANKLKGDSSAFRRFNLTNNLTITNTISLKINF